MRGSADARRLWRLLYQIEGLDAQFRAHQTLPALVEGLLSQRIGPYTNVLEEREDELTDPTGDPATVTLAETLAGALHDCGHEVCVVTDAPAFSDHYPLNEGIGRITLDLPSNSDRFYSKIRRNLRRVVRLRRVLLKLQPGAVIAFGDTVSVRALLAGVGTSVPVVVSERVDPRQNRQPLSLTLLRRLLYPRAAAVVMQTESVAKWARDFIACSRVKVIPNPLHALTPALLLNLFALTWGAHGLRYGVGREIELWQAAGCKVVVSGSRAHILKTLTRRQDVTPILITAPPEIQAERLRRRGREDAAAINERLARAKHLQSNIRV